MSANPKIGTYEYFAQLHEVEEKHWWSRGMRDIADMMIRRTFNGRTDLDILDAGCGTGITLSWLRSYSQPNPVVGIDISEHALDFCRARGHSEVHQASVTDVPFDDERFDLIVCHDVIQHLADDRAALREFYRVLRPGGALLVRTNTKLGIGKDTTAASRDYRMYTCDELRTKTTEAGLRVQQMSHVNMLMSLALIIKRYFRERGKSEYDDRGLPIRLLPPHLAWLNTLLHGLLQIEARYLSDPERSLPFGSAIIYIAEKSK